MWRGALKCGFGLPYYQIAEKFLIWAGLFSEMRRLYPNEAISLSLPALTPPALYLHVDIYNGTEFDTRNVNIGGGGYQNSNFTYVYVQYHLLHFYAVGPYALSNRIVDAAERQLVDEMFSLNIAHRLMPRRPNPYIIPAQHQRPVTHLTKNTTLC